MKRNDAQGYGYRTPQKAYAGYSYRIRSQEDKARYAQKEREIFAWMKQNPKFVEAMDIEAFDVMKGAYGPGYTFGAKEVKKMLDNFGFSGLPFTAGELIRCWERGKPLYSETNRGERKVKKKKVRQYPLSRAENDGKSILQEKDLCPLNHDELNKLKKYLSEKGGCDGTLKYTAEWLKNTAKKPAFEAEQIMAWLQQHGGFCDCEVVLNVEAEKPEE